MIDPAPDSAPRTPHPAPDASDDALARAVEAARAADAKKAHDVCILAVADTFGAADYFVLASASNDRQVRAIASAIEERLHLRGAKPNSREGMRDGGWILLDYGDVVVHAFLDETRDFYQLERLWADSPRVVWEPDPAPAPDADDPGLQRAEAGAADEWE